MAEGRLTGNQIMRLSNAISSVNMAKIATGYMGLSKEVVQNIESANRANQEGINSDIFEKWKNKPQNSGPDQVKRLAALLYQASEMSYVSADIIMDILRVPFAPATETGQSETSAASKADTGPGTLPETKLTDGMIWRLASKITTEADLNTVATGGLDIDEDVVNTSLTNNREITVAAKNVLKQWLHSQSNRQVAYTKMVKGLQRVKPLFLEALD